MTAIGNGVQLKAPEFGFVKGEALNRLKEGRPVRFDFLLAVLSDPRGPVVAETRQSFNLSYDLWEERFAVSLVGPLRMDYEKAIRSVRAAAYELSRFVESVYEDN